MTVGTDDDRLQTFRRVRDQIAARLRVWLASRPWAIHPGFTCPSSSR